MAIVQISKIQQRSGNLVDLPQLDDAEFGWASDEKRLFIGKSTPNENIEVLTSYSNISFSQINGSDGGNFNISAAENGQLLTYVSSTGTWENFTGTTQLGGGKIQLTDVSNISIEGGAIGYVLETDGTGNLSWTPKGALYTNIVALSNATPIVMTVDSATPFTNDARITITGVEGASNSIVNGQSFYIQLAVDYPTSGNVSLYDDPSGVSPVNGTGLTYTNSPNAIATSIIATGGGSGAAAGSSTSIQYNNSGIFAGDANLLWDFTNNQLTVSGNANVSSNVNVTGNINLTRQLISTIATGTAPLTVTSTTRVSNLNVATSGVANTVNDAAQPNITSVGTLTSLNSSGNITAPIVIANANGTGNNFKVGDDVWLGDINVTNTMVIKGQQDAANGYIIFGTGDTTSTLGRAGTGALTYNGAFTSNGNLIAANVNTAGNVTASRLISNVATGTAPLVVTSTTQVANLNAATAGSATTAGTVTTAAQPNITSTGTLTAVSVTGNVTTGGVKTDNYYYANGVAISFNGTYSNSNVASYLPTYTGQVGTTGTSYYGNVLSTGANTTTGVITGNWSLSSGSKLNATYADLAEYYEADQPYEPGTVLQFGGDKEVTIAEDGTNRVAGVVSTDPAYVMNSGCEGDAVAIALQGRVPTKVRGTIRKGDMMVSGGNGYARPSIAPQMGTVIGKALENFDGVEGIIEVAVGRL